MTQTSNSVSTGNCSADRMLPRDVACGVAGLHQFDCPKQWNQLGPPDTNGSTSQWRYGTSCLVVRGDVVVSSSDIWTVFLYGGSNNADAIRSLLDKSKVILGRIDISPEGLKQLCWKLLPSAFVVGIHHSTSSICLICDPSSFRPAYYARSGETLHFSTSLKALRGQVDFRGVNTDKISQMLAFGHRTGRRILWQGINCVAPGELVLHSSQHRTQRTRFWLPENVFDVNERHRIQSQSISETRDEACRLVEEALTPLLKLSNLAVPCGGGVDSSFLACYAVHARQETTPVWCINQPESTLRESDWMESFSRTHGIECKYANVSRESFIRNLMESLNHSHQPLPGPNFVGGKVLGNLAQLDGVKILLSGELCDTVFGGLSGFYHLSPRFRALRQLSRLNSRMRLWLVRALGDVPAWLLGLMHVGHSDSAALYAQGDLENAEIIHEAIGFRYDGQTQSQYLADVVTWMQMRTVPSALHAAFYDRMDAGGPAFEFPFAQANIMRFGIHLPHYLKRRSGQNKWLWRTIAAQYVGNKVAFRRKESFPTLTERWLDKLPALLTDGFLSELLCVDVAKLYEAIPKGDTCRWTIANCELWGRLHCRLEESDSLFDALI